MKKIIGSFIIVMCLALAGISCTEYLEFEETDLIAGDLALKTVENNQSAIIGAYGGVNNLMSILFNSVTSDEVKTAGEFYNSATVHEWSYGDQDVTIRDTYTAINPLYQIIDRVNRVLALVDKADSLVVGDNKLRLKLKGEALFLRAYAHFELYRFYSKKYETSALGMPYMEVPSMAPQARIGQDLYFEKLNRDLDEAKGLLPNNILDINRANVAAAHGLHARVALYEEDWEAAEVYATKYITTPGLELATIATFPGIWTDANTAEQAFRTVRTPAMTSPTTSPSLPARIGSLYRNTSASAANIGTVIWTVSDELYDSYATNDVRRSAYFKTDATLAALNRPNPARPGLIISKYAGSAYGTANENVVNAKVMRTAEMYLIRAEARAQQNRFTGANSAESDLNTLRSNRIPAYSDVVLTSKNQALEEILMERFKELAFEGHRFWDLKRTGNPVTRLPSDALSAASQTLPANDYRFALPIPRTELQANRLMEQNPNY